MPNRLPDRKRRAAHRICIICERYEDYEYFRKLEELKVWANTYEFKLVNAKSATKIPQAYHNYYTRLFWLFAIQTDILTSSMLRSRSVLMKNMEGTSKAARPPTQPSSTNLGRFLDHFHDADSGWIQQINDQLNEDEDDL